MIWTDNPERDFATWDAEQAEFEAKCPYCEECGQKITSGYLIKDDDGDYYHEECFNKHYRMDITDYLERV